MLPDQRRDSASWVDVLDRMEEDLATTADPSAPIATWVIPDGIGQLPPEQAERARHILEGQHQAIERLENLKRTTGRHLAALRTVPAARGEDGSVYLDVRG